MELKQIQLEILEAERLIERNRMILQLHIKLEEMTAQKEKEKPDGN
ncbi:MAG: hypothetical protein PHN84_03355 [Desulfuromonadaceae bacterium]|nr:hypothetical protein [Desulfuromonadaceae bacterium]MDD2854221.1 hypothetical protein [Desulfuromonadaceae bacterium]